MTQATHNCVVLVEKGVKVRNEPNTNNVSSMTMAWKTPFQISAIVPDSLDPNNPAKKWGKIFGGQYDGKYTALEYPSNPSPISSYTPIENPTKPEEPEPSPIFPESFVLTDPSGARAEYVFVRVIEE